MGKDYIFSYGIRNYKDGFVISYVIWHNRAVYYHNADYYADITSPRAVLQGVKMALVHVPDNSSVILITTSEYAIFALKSYNKVKENAKNKDLLQSIHTRLSAMKQFDHTNKNTYKAKQITQTLISNYILELEEGEYLESKV